MGAVGRSRVLLDGFDLPMAGLLDSKQPLLRIQLGFHSERKPRPVLDAVNGIRLDDQVAVLLELLHLHSDSLEVLSIRGGDADDGWHSSSETGRVISPTFIEALPELPRLRTLSLANHRSGVDDDLVETLVRLLPAKMPLLQQLDLRGPAPPPMQHSPTRYFRFLSAFASMSTPRAQSNHLIID